MKKINLLWIIGFLVIVISTSGYSITRTHSVNFTVYDIPVVQLISPLTGVETTLTEITLIYNVSDFSNGITNCSLYINNEINQTDNTIVENTPQNFTVNLTIGTYNWFVSCIDNSSGKYQGNSSTNSFSITLTPTITTVGGGSSGFMTLNCSYNGMYVNQAKYCCSGVMKNNICVNEQDYIPQYNITTNLLKVTAIKGKNSKGQFTIVNTYNHSIFVMIHSGLTDVNYTIEAFKEQIIEVEFNATNESISDEVYITVKYDGMEYFYQMPVKINIAGGSLKAVSLFESPEKVGRNIIVIVATISFLLIVTLTLLFYKK